MRSENCSSRASAKPSRQEAPWRATVGGTAACLDRDSGVAPRAQAFQWTTSHIAEAPRRLVISVRGLHLARAVRGASSAKRAFPTSRPPRYADEGTEVYKRESELRRFGDWH